MGVTEGSGEGESACYPLSLSLSLARNRKRARALTGNHGRLSRELWRHWPPERESTVTTTDAAAAAATGVVCARRACARPRISNHRRRHCRQFACRVYSLPGASPPAFATPPYLVLEGGGGKEVEVFLRAKGEDAEDRRKGLVLGVGAVSGLWGHWGYRVKEGLNEGLETMRCT